MKYHSILPPNKLKVELPNICLVPFSLGTPFIVKFGVPIPSIMAPIEFKQLTKSLISGSLAAFCKIVVPLARTEASIRFSVAPTEIFGNIIRAPDRPLGTEA